MSFEIIKDISDPKAFESLFKKRSKEIDVVLHTASPVVLNTNDYEKDLLIPAINGTKGILNAVRRYGNVKKIIITSSYVTMVDFAHSSDGSLVFTEKDWSPVTWEGCQTNAVNGYCGSKKFAEQETWKFAKEACISLTTINPVFVFGPQKLDEDVGPQLNVSNEIINNLLHNKPGDGMEPDHHASYIDVRDVAKAHLVTFQKGLPGEGLGLSNNRFGSQDILDILNERFPYLNISKGPEPGKGDINPGAIFDNKHSRDVLGFPFINLEQSVYDTAAQVLKKDGLLKYMG